MSFSVLDTGNPLTKISMPEEGAPFKDHSLDESRLARVVEKKRRW
jgi:hypothetical protein